MGTWLSGMRVTADRLNDNTPHTVNYTSITANTPNNTGTEAVALTTASITFRAGRAYRITFKGLAQSSVANDQVTVRVRKTNTSGDVYVDSFRIPIPTAGGNFPFYLANICANTGTSDVTAVLVGTYVRLSGTGNTVLAATTTHVCYVEVEDIGDAGDFAGARAIV
ncbi:hypothetical protein OG407_07195 [Streptomyces sp. NBC_01515]|uniref:hypothetical protein n=1 Tax=Streptomyces sp. NBC_01515 TaxID=2903890 RepID=UPI00386C39AB